MVFQFPTLAILILKAQLHPGFHVHLERCTTVNQSLNNNRRHPIAIDQTSRNRRRACPALVVTSPPHSSFKMDRPPGYILSQLENTDITAIIAIRADRIK